MFRINVKTIKGEFLHYTHVKSYKYVDGMLEFFDNVDKKIKRFSPQNCEIEEEGKE